MNQKWIEVREHRLCICTNENTGKTKKIIIFLPGWGQSKAGSYFLYSQIANEMEKYNSLLLDYYGFGDSDGEFENCSYEDTFFQCAELVKKCYEKYEEIVLIASGFANRIAQKLTEKHSDLKAILIEPCIENIDNFKSVKYIRKIKEMKVIDTSILYESFDDSEKLFLFFRRGI